MHRCIHLTTSLALLTALAVTLGCDDNSTNNNTAEANGGASMIDEDPDAMELRQQVLSDISEDVILATYTDFAQDARALETAVAAWKQSGSAADRASAQGAWRDAIRTWQRAEVYQVGPTGLMSQTLGGEAMRDDVYSWPLLNTCRIDREIVEQDYQDAAAFAESELINVRGLGAMEYLLFREDADNDCAPTVTPNSDGAWSSLDQAQIDTRRAAYAHALSTNLIIQADVIVDAWSADDGGFVTNFTAIGDGDSIYPSTQEALNAIFDAVFYVEKETKDMKLGVPSGSRMCSQDICPDDLELPWSEFSKEAAIANIRAFEAVYLGNQPDAAEEGRGFDDMLIAAEAEDLDMQIKTAIAEAIAALEAVNGSLKLALQEDPQSVVNAYDKAKALGDLVKTQLVSVLDLEIPMRAEGDND